MLHLNEMQATLKNARLNECNLNVKLNESEKIEERKLKIGKEK